MGVGEHWDQFQFAPVTLRTCCALPSFWRAWPFQLRQLAGGEATSVKPGFNFRCLPSEHMLTLLQQCQSYVQLLYGRS